MNREIRHFHLFCGLGGGARGFNRATPRVGNMTGQFRCLGGIDVDPAAVRDFSRLAGVPGTCLDLFDRGQYRDFHGAEPPGDWREAGPDDIRKAAGGEHPHIVFLSAPCKGLSGLLPQAKSVTPKYQALNRLTLRGVWLMLEAFADDLPELVIFENVPRIQNRGRHLLDQIGGLLRGAGYAVAETTHDCGEIGGLAQSRKRFLLVARNLAKVPPFLYEPPRRPLRAVGDILGKMPPPSDPAGGPMHRCPALAWKTWVRLAFVEAGSDWRSLNKLAVQDGVLRDYLIVPDCNHGSLGVLAWDQTAGAVCGESLPTNGCFSVADPRFDPSAKWRDGHAYGVKRWEEHANTLAAGTSPGQGCYAVADPRHFGSEKRSNEFRIVRFDQASRTVTGAHGTGQCVADPRNPGQAFGKYAITPWGAPSGTIISGSTTGQGAFAVADPCPSLASRRKGDAFVGGGHYGVLDWRQHSGAVSAAANCDNGRFSVADPRLPAANDKLVCVIRALDGTWHRPFTTLELAALQSLIDPEETFELDGTSDQDWRERIGNAVPPDAARAIAETMGQTLLLAWSGETFALSSLPIWVKPVAVALAVEVGHD